MTEPRYAVYFAPHARDSLAIAGSHWLGRDAIGNVMLPQPACPGLVPARLAELTAMARRYGLHATLKPPFRLQPGHAVQQLEAAVQALAATRTPFEFHVELSMLDGFLAWTPRDAQAQLASVAAACVMQLDDFRQPPDAAELARRRKALTLGQEAMLQRWGYPFVLDEFRFHITLSDPVAGVEADAMSKALTGITLALADTPQTFDSLCLFVEPAPGAPLRLHARFGFDGSVTRHG